MSDLVLVKRKVKNHLDSLSGKISFSKKRIGKGKKVFDIQIESLIDHMESLMQRFDEAFSVKT